MHVFDANGVYPDQTQRSVASDLGLYCLHISHLWDSRYKTVNMLLSKVLANRKRTCYTSNNNNNNNKKKKQKKKKQKKKKKKKKTLKYSKILGINGLICYFQRFWLIGNAMLHQWIQIAIDPFALFHHSVNIICFTVMFHSWDRVPLCGWTICFWFELNQNWV